VDGMENKSTHLQMLQAVITRMAGNSFLLKGWSVTLVSALFALSADRSNGTFAYVAVLPVLMFWGLDAYFLRQERLFRKLYDRVRAIPADDVDFSMNTATVAQEVSGWFRVCFSRTLLPFHLALLATVAVVSIVVKSAQ
jgi:hypothetical protein